MKPFLTLLLAAALLLASGCAIVRVERYVHKPTDRVKLLWSRWPALPRDLRPAEGEVLLVPNFRTFSTTYSGPQSSLNVYTRGHRPVFIIDADLEIVATGFKQSIVLNVMTNPVEMPNDEGYWGAGLPLFSAQNIDFSKISGADDLVLTIRWRDGDRIAQQRFPLRRSSLTAPSWID